MALYYGSMTLDALTRLTMPLLYRLHYRPTMFSRLPTKYRESSDVLVAISQHYPH